MLSLLVGATVIVACAALAAATGYFHLLKAGFALGLLGARLAEGLFSHSCPLAKVSLEGAVLALVGILLVAADELLASLLA